MCDTMLRHLGCMSTVCIIAAFPPKLLLSLALMCHLYRANPCPCAFFFSPLHQCQWSIKAYRECTLSNLLSVCVRMCVFTLWGRSFLRVRDVSEAGDLLRAPSYFSGCNICFTIDRQKWPHALLPHNSFSKKFCNKSTNCGFSTPSATQMQAQQQRYDTQKYWQSTSEKDRMMKSARKDQSLYIISAINTLVHLPTTCFFPAGWCSFPPVLCASCATCCAGPC